MGGRHGGVVALVCCRCGCTVAGVGGTSRGGGAGGAADCFACSLARRAARSSRSLFCCSLINFCNRFNEQCLTLFFFPPMAALFTLRFGQSRCGPGAGGGVVCLAVIQMVGSGLRGGVLFLVCLLWTRLLVRSVVGSIGSTVLACFVVVCLGTF